MERGGWSDTDVVSRSKEGMEFFEVIHDRRFVGPFRDGAGPARMVGHRHAVIGMVESPIALPVLPGVGSEHLREPAVRLALRPPGEFHWRFLLRIPEAAGRRYRAISGRMQPDVEAVRRIGL